MLHFFRSFMHSRIGVFLALGFLVLIALAFAAADVTGSGQFGSVTGGDRVASVGNRKISTAELGQAATSALDQTKQDNPGLTMAAFVAAGGLGETLDQLIDRAAISVFGENHGVVASDRLVDSEIAKIDAFNGLDGKFNQNTFKAVLAQKGLTEAGLRRDIADGLVAREMLVPAAFGSRLPTGLVARYAALLTESRAGTVGLLPAAAFAPKGEPNAAELTAFYTAHQSSYIRPERRVIRYAVFDDSAIRNVPAPTEAEIAARYNGNKALYAPSELRKITQIILPTEAAAKAVLAEVDGGKTGLATATLNPLARPALASQTSEAVASAAFAAAKGKVAGPVRAPLGWALIRIDTVEAKPGKTLDQARAEIATDLAAIKKRTALSDFTAKVEDEFDHGGSLGDVIKELSLTLQQTDPLTANGQVYGKDAKAPAELTRVLQTAFAMEREGQPQLAEVVPGKQFVLYDVSQITPSVAAPIAEIRPAVMADLMLAKGAAAAKAAAEKVRAAVGKGQDLGAALSALGVPLPGPQKIDISRQQFAAQGNRVPPPIALMFSMAQGTTKILSAPGNRGWFVVSLGKITPGTDAQIAPILAQATSELSQVAGREYAEELRKAIRDDVGSTKNQTAIDAVKRQLVGGTN